MSENGFGTIEVAEILKTGLAPHTLTPAPYVLVVDDEHALADTLAVILRANGYAVTVAYDAESAADIAELAPPQLLVTDFALPGRNGAELAFRIQELAPDCKVILATGMPELAAGYLLPRAAHFSVLAKPIQPAELLKAISDPCCSSGAFSV